MSKNFKNQWYKEALKYLDQYNKNPFFYDFLDKYNIDYKKGAAKCTLLNEIEIILRSKQAPDLFDLIQ